jgi:hypothetical protein
MKKTNLEKEIYLGINHDDDNQWKQELEDDREDGVAETGIGIRREERRWRSCNKIEIGRRQRRLCSCKRIRIGRRQRR